VVDDCWLYELRYYAYTHQQRIAVIDNISSYMLAYNIVVKTVVSSGET